MAAAKLRVSATRGVVMRIERSVTSISWLPSEAVEGIVSLAFHLGVTRYDSPPPDQIDNLDELAANGAFRFANQLRAFIEVQDGKVVSSGHLGKGVISGSDVHFGPARLRFSPVLYPVLRPEPSPDDDGVRFVQTVGGRTSLPSPRRIAGTTRVHLDAPAVWTTLALTIRPDGTHSHEMIGASSIPRHWVFDTDGRLVQKSALMGFTDWYNTEKPDTPWGGLDGPVLVAEVESSLERRLSHLIMQGSNAVKRRSVAAGDTLVRQGEPGTEVFLLLDGKLVVEIDGVDIGEVGPGAILGEYAVLGGGVRTATLRAATRVRVAAIAGTNLDRVDLSALGEEHRPTDPADIGP
jgi:hypothetical protein